MRFHRASWLSRAAWSIGCGILAAGCIGGCVATSPGEKTDASAQAGQIGDGGNTSSPGGSGGTTLAPGSGGATATHDSTWSPCASDISAKLWKDHFQESDPRPRLTACLGNITQNGNAGFVVEAMQYGGEQENILLTLR